MSYESDKRFREYKADLDARCREHLKSHPEKSVYDRGPIKFETAIERTLVEVNQIDNAGEAYVVLRNGIKMDSFYGKDAAVLAASYANRLLNGDSSVLPKNPCMFCGGYSCHREGCIDKPKNGMTL